MSLAESILRVKEIGVEIAKLSLESKELRKQIAQDVESSGLGTVSEVESVEFLIGNLRVSVIQEKGGKDFTVTFKELVNVQ